MKYCIILVAVIGIGLMSCGDESDTKEKNPYSTADQETSKGGQLFNSYCIQCHALDHDKVGPALKGALAHWDSDTSRIRAFIINAGESIRSGDPRAVQVAKDWNNAMMTPMPHLNNDDVNAILEYIAE